MAEGYDRRDVYDGDPRDLDLDCGTLLDALAGARRDADVALRVRVTLQDGRVVTRRARRLRVTYARDPMLGFDSLELEAEVDVLPEGDVEAMLELGLITEDECWDMLPDVDWD